MQKSCQIPLNEHFQEVREFSHSKTHSAKPFIPRFEDKIWTSILYIERGNFHIQYETGEILRARGGAFYYHPPLSLKYQTYDKTITPYSMYHIAIDLTQISDLACTSLVTGQKKQIVLPDKPFVRLAPSLLVASFKRIVAEYNDKQPGFLFQIENSIRQILISAFRSSLEQDQRPKTSNKYVAKVNKFLAENRDFKGPVEQLFEEMGVSRSRGYDIFHQTFGITPKEYILRRKIVFAKEMLLKNMTITTIAYELGFSSSQSFATSFKKLTCATPSNYRKNSRRST